MKFNRSNIARFGKHLNRSPKVLDIKKTCLDCGKGFNKNRPKTAKVFVPDPRGQPVDSGRHVCQCCYQRRLLGNGKAA